MPEKISNAMKWMEVSKFMTYHKECHSLVLVSDLNHPPSLCFRFKVVSLIHLLHSRYELALSVLLPDFK